MGNLIDQILSAVPAPMREQLRGYVDGFWEILPNLAFAAVFLLITALIIFGALWLTRRVTRRMRASLQDAILLILKVGLWTLAILIAATIAFPSLSIGNLFTAAGVGGLAIAFAARDTLENFFAGVNLLARRTFDNGDYVECEGIEGQVENIAIRETQIRQTDGQLVVAPNKVFFQNPLTIRTSRDVRRTTVICGVAYGEDVDASRDVIRKAVEACESVRARQFPVQIFAQEFASSSINFEVTWWTGPRPLDIRQSRDEVVAAVKRALDEAEIEIPFPYRTLTFKEPLGVEERGGRDAERDVA